MSDRMSLPKLLLVCLFLSLTSSCSTAPAAMAVPETLVSVDPLPVAGANPRTWNRPISFGPWKTAKVREGLRWDFAKELPGVEAGYAQKRYRLLLVGDGEDGVQAECVARSLRLSRGGFSIDPTFGKLPPLVCAFRSLATDDHWTLTLRKGGQRMRGEISDSRGSERILAVRSVHDLQDGWSGIDPVGFEIEAERSVIGAVETINRGRVWIEPDLDRRSQERVASAAAVLLIWEPVED